MTTTAPELGGRYRLRDELGRGGMSTVYRAEDLLTGAEVAVKVYATAATFDARTRQLREAAFGSSLAHDGIARLLDHGEELATGADPRGDGARTYLVTELVDGPTLRQRLNRNLCTPEEVRILGARLADVLAYLHSVGIVHRDVKPANVLLPGYGESDLERAKLTDLGVAIRLEDTRVTVEGSVVGTATYLSPEQVRGAAITPATDIYALGLVLLEAMAGVASFEGSGVECALARLHRPPAVPASTPQWLAALLAAMTAMDPARRPDAAAVATALRERSLVGGVAGVGLGTSTIDLGSARPEPVVFAEPDQPTSVLTALPATRSRRWPLGAAAAAAIVLVVAGVAFSSSSGGSVVPPASGRLATTPAAASSAASAPTSHSAPTRPSATVVAQKSTAPAPKKSAVAVVKRNVAPAQPAPKPARPTTRKRHHGGHHPGG